MYLLVRRKWNDVWVANEKKKIKKKEGKDKE